jgi:5,6,7,8-tetrahydromethanopterin hydro-lyase
VLRIGEAFAGEGRQAAHVSLLLGTNAFLGSAFAIAAASPGPGHVPFQVVLRPNLPVRPATLFIGKAALRDARHERMTWGPAQAGVAVGMTRALLAGLLPLEAERDWLCLALVWVDWQADDADLIYANNRDATFTAAERALKSGAPSPAELALGLAQVGNPFYTPTVP